MANSRIKDIATTAASAASDDYLVIDGATNGTRKIAASAIGGGGGSSIYDFTSALSPSVDSRGVYSYSCKVTPTNSADVTASNAAQLSAYLINSGATVYPLITASVIISSGFFTVTFKSINSSTQSTSSDTITGTLHVLTPFEVSSVSGLM